MQYSGIFFNLTATCGPVIIGLYREVVAYRGRFLLYDLVLVPLIVAPCVSK